VPAAFDPSNSRPDANMKT